MESRACALPTWKLEDLYCSIEDPQLDKDLAEALCEFTDFENTYKNTIANDRLDSVYLREALDAYEVLLRLNKGNKPLAFASLLTLRDTQNVLYSQLLQKVIERWSIFNKIKSFFEVEINQIPQHIYEKIIRDDQLEPYRHYLDKIRAMASHVLSVAEERIMTETASVRGEALVRVFSEINNQPVEVTNLRGETERVGIGGLHNRLHSPDRAIRKLAAEHISRVLRERAPVGTCIYNILLQEKEISDRLREYNTAEAESNLRNELSQETLQVVMAVSAENSDIVADYYKFKSHLLGIEDFAYYDRFAPFGIEQGDIPFDQAKTIVLEAFGAFSPRFAELAELFFKNGWIDTPALEGKAGGASTEVVTPDLPPYIYVNYTGKPFDITVMAHELGHGIHFLLANRNSSLDYIVPFPLIEMASAFGEMLVFDRLQASLTSSKNKEIVLYRKIEETLWRFDSLAAYQFELQAHRTRRERGELPREVFNQMWLEKTDAVLGSSVKTGEDYSWWWLGSGLIFGSPFYSYSYTFGEFLVQSLYAQYREQGHIFVEKYTEMLTLGGTRNPYELLAIMGFDIRDPAFWRSGYGLFRERVQHAIHTVAR